MTVSLTEFRKNAYRLANQVLQTGVPLEIVHNSRKLRLVPEKPTRLTDRIVPHPTFIMCDPEELERIGWSNEWQHNF